MFLSPYIELAQVAIFSLAWYEMHQRHVTLASHQNIFVFFVTLKASPCQKDNTRRD